MSNLTVTIIGASGKMGTQIATGLAVKGYKLILNSRDNSKITIQKRENVKLVTSQVEAAMLGQVIILALPYKVNSNAAKLIKEVSKGKIVISIANPLNDSYSELVTGWESSAGEELQAELPESKVVKAFNTIFAGKINNPIINNICIDHMLAGNDVHAVEKVQQIVRDLGHNPIHIGGIEESRTLEHMAQINIRLNSQGIFQWNSVYKLLS